MFYIQDIGVALVFTVLKDGRPENLTGVVKVELIINGFSGPRLCTVTDAANGIVQYTTVAGDFPTSSAYTGVLRVTYSGSKVLHTTPFSFEVKNLFQ